MSKAAKPSTYVPVGIVLILMGIITAVLGPAPLSDIPTQAQSDFFTILFISFGVLILVGNTLRRRSQ